MTGAAWALLDKSYTSIALWLWLCPCATGSVWSCVQMVIRCSPSSLLDTLKLWPKILRVVKLWFAGAADTSMRSAVRTSLHKTPFACQTQKYGAPIRKQSCHRPSCIQRTRLDLRNRLAGAKGRTVRPASYQNGKVPTPQGKVSQRSYLVNNRSRQALKDMPRDDAAPVRFDCTLCFLAHSSVLVEIQEFFSCHWLRGRMGLTL